MATTEKPITELTPLEYSPSSLSGYNFTMDSSGSPARLAGSVFANIVMGKTQPNLKIWVGTSTEYSNLSSSVKSDTSTVFIVK